MNDNLQLFGGDELKKLRRILFQILSLCNISVDNGPHELHVFGTKLQDIDGRDSARLVFKLVKKNNYILLEERRGVRVATYSIAE